ncbi:MAG: hypothetical protein P1U61_08730 [Legionellaceae bacterium]|nr:hypothetical protein [Legionellaceae bacterium]
MPSLISALRAFSCFTSSVNETATKKPVDKVTSHSLHRLTSYDNPKAIACSSSNTFIPITSSRKPTETTKTKTKPNEMLTITLTEEHLSKVASSLKKAKTITMSELNSPTESPNTQPNPSYSSLAEMTREGSEDQNDDYSEYAAAGLTF